MNSLLDYAARFDHSQYLLRHQQAFQQHMDIPLWAKAKQLLSGLKQAQLPEFDVQLDPFLHAKPEACLPATLEQTIQLCAEALIPWRTGPFQIADLFIDAEWRSYMKWERISEALGDLSGQIVADVGCNNGFFMFKLAARNPSLVLGLDPSGRCGWQFQFLQIFAQVPNLVHTPLKLEDLDLFPEFFHQMLCMGVIYHRRDPLSSLRMLKNALRPGGKLILESLIIPGEDSTCLFPEQRYAKMKNVYFIPTLACLRSWMKRTNFDHIEVLEVSALTTDEQRKTDFAPYESLEEFQDSESPAKTTEGYPWPLRATLSGIKTR